MGKRGGANPGVFAFEAIGADLKLLPLAARRALDLAGKKLSLAAWSAMPIDARRKLIEIGSAANVDAAEALRTIAEAEPAARSIERLDESCLVEPDARAQQLLGPQRPLSAMIWSRLHPLGRFAVRHLGARGDAERLAAAYDEIAGDGAGGLTHLSPSGEAHMVDVGEKSVSHRRAVARARVRLQAETARLVRDGTGPKGDVLAAARIAGIMAAKRTSELIPLCHPIALSRVTVELSVDDGGVTIEATAEAHDRTGVEMEAMTAASIAALTIYDMLKAVERGIAIEEVLLVEKSGGRSGHYRREKA